jgi:HEAT repeat protein
MGPEAETAIPALLKSLQDPQAAVRKAAADALGNLGVAAKEAVPALATLLSDKESAVRGPAARALGRIGPEAKPAIRALAELLDDKTEYKEGVTMVYWAIGNPLEDFAKTLCVRDNAAEALRQIGPEATLPALTDLLGDEKAEVRRAAAEALGLFGREAKTAVPNLIATLRDESWEFRHSATEALGEIGVRDQHAVPELVRMLANEDQDDILIASVERMQRALELRKAVAEALRKMRPDVTRSLTEMLQDKDARVRTVTAQLLGEIGPEAKAAIPALMDLLQDTEHGVRFAAVQALGKMGPEAKDATADLQQLLEDEDEQLRQAAAEALKAIGQREE